MNRKTGFIILFWVLFFIQSAGAQPLSLEKAVEMALNNNPQVIAARDNVDSASAKRGQAGSNLLPKLTLDGSVGRIYQQPSLINLPASLGGGTFSTSPDEQATATSYGLALRQTVFTGGKVLMGYLIADINYQVAFESLRRTEHETAYNVVTSYYDLMKARKGLEVINSSIANLNHNLEQTQVFYNAGIVSSVDLLRVKTQLANLMIGRLTAENGIKLAWLSFQNVLGQTLTAEAALKEPPLKDPAELTLGQDELLALAYVNRPEWTAFNLGLQAAEKGLTIAYGNFLPSVAYVYTQARNKVEYDTTKTSNSDLQNWRSMLVGSWNIFDGFDTINKVREAVANVKGAKAQAQAIKDLISLEVNSAYYSLLSAAEKIKASQTAADLADRTLKSAEVNYKANVISEQMYLDSQSANLSAQLNLWTARYDYDVAKARLNKAVGKIVI
ncbi:MAG: TolC family protein [Candidatus Margulisbacteria bacterium]|nr:TolC family protein [Candidatus Margulisiibacteriota bacterium]